jgi:hypothetical protein
MLDIVGSDYHVHVTAFIAADVYLVPFTGRVQNR